ncbi:CLUMA_CG007082, isoform A [Clunio marinus]|uniref:CLUMA_CG007082, isoform A n=1 Tax=Clunio marinus TaxID=568069 RepID=A0A1J1HZU7_9DIPT|nr:CLUMA_CG007082, isoform A [Clunio marinus]
MNHLCQQDHEPANVFIVEHFYVGEVLMLKKLYKNYSQYFNKSFAIFCTSIIMRAELDVLNLI